MKIFSLNVWFNDYLKKERSQILAQYLLEKDYDIICLQEVTASMLSYVYKIIHEKYPNIHLDLEDDFYGVCMISKNEIKNREILKFKNSRMKRCLLIGEINNIKFATTHLESEFGKLAGKKIQQFNDCINILSNYEKVLFVGDTNLTPKNEKFLNLKEFTDIYLKIDNSYKNKYTYDGIKNPLIKNKIRSRVDRAFIKNINAISFDLEKSFIMSDHYGLIIKI